MFDLKDQIRTYYESTTTPVDVDAIAVDEGTVLVGPFPDAVQRRKNMKTMPKTTEQSASRWRAPRVAMAAFGATVVVVLAVFAVVSLSDPDTTLDVASGGPAAVIQNYVDAYNAEDIDGIMALFTEESVLNRHPMGIVALGGIAEIREVQIRDIATSTHTGDAYVISNVEVSGNTVTWDHVWTNNVGVDWCAEGHSAVIEAGKILSWTFAPNLSPCP